MHSSTDTAEDMHTFSEKIRHRQTVSVGYILATKQSANHIELELYGVQQLQQKYYCYYDRLHRHHQ